MERSFQIKASIIIFLLSVILSCTIGCGNESTGSPEKKAYLSRTSKQTLIIYDILNDYPALESFFTYGDLEISEFENLLFGDFLGKDATADIIVSMIDLFPILIDTGTDFETRSASSVIFSDEIQSEMESKGAIPDLLANIGVITEQILAVEEDKRTPFYDYLDKLTALENSKADSKGTLDYILDILVDIMGYLDTLEEDDINLFMNFSAEDKLEMQESIEGVIDYADLDELLEKWLTESPEGVIEILDSLKALFYDEEFKDTLAAVLNKLAIFLGNEQTYPEVKALLTNMYARYDKDSLGEIIDRLWDKGPIIGEEISKLDIEGYGADGKQDTALRILLKHPEIIKTFFETCYMFKQYGVEFDKVDDQLDKMVNTNPFCFDKKGEGELGNGQFYQPADNFSYQNLSNLRGVLNIFSRWNVPFTLTSPWIYELENPGWSRALIRTFVPEADSLSLGSFIWGEIYEKDPDKLMGSGSPVTEKKGYGIMKNGVYVAPLCPALQTAGSIPCYTMAWAIENGPYDNIYDNLNWHYYDHKMYLIIDLVQLAPYVPLLKNTVLPFLKLAGIKQLPLNLIEITGAQNLINLEVSDVLRNLPEAISYDLLQIKMPQFMVDLVVQVLKKVLPMGTPLENNARVYLLSQDVRDTACVVWSLTFYDQEAFHLDRFQDLADPENYMHFYDTREYTYKNNYDTANQVWGLGAAVFYAAFKCYSDIVDAYPRSLDSVEDRQNAAKSGLGTIYPMTYLFNIVTSLYEHATETPLYEIKDTDVYHPVYLMEQLMSMESTGLLDELLNLLVILGKPDLADARDKFFNGVAMLVDTVDSDSTSPYTIAAEILKTPEKAESQPQRWDALKLTLDYFHGILDENSDFEIVQDLVALFDHLTGVEVSDEDWRSTCEGIAEVIKGTAETRALTRARFQQATIVDEINKLHIWGDAIDMLNEMVKDDGIYSYVLRGMEKDPENAWDDVLEDTNAFFHSELMVSYDEGSFWKDTYYLLDFLADAIEESQE